MNYMLCFSLIRLDGISLLRYMYSYYELDCYSKLQYLNAIFTGSLGLESQSWLD